jgi:hypothetical protein
MLVARFLAFWYVVVIVGAVGAAAAAFVWLSRTSPEDMYWSCMQPQIPAVKELGWKPQQVFGEADALCDRPSELSREAALREWIRLWGSA